MKKEVLEKIGLPIIICALAFALEAIPLGIFGVIIRGAAVTCCLVCSCGIEIKPRAILIGAALTILGVPLFGMLLGVIMEGGLIFPSILEFVAYFVVFYAIYCKVSKQIFENIGWLVAILPAIMAFADGTLAVLPAVIAEFDGEITDTLEFMSLVKTFSVFRNLMFYIALGVAAVKCRLSLEKNQNSR